MANGTTPAGWYPDPSGAPGQTRYWDGVQWTQQVQAAQQQPYAAPAAQPYQQAPGAQPYQQAYMPTTKQINKIAYILLTWFLGGLGVHRFIRGQIGIGILYLISVGGFGIAWLIDIIVSLVKLSHYSGMDNYEFTISPRGQWTR
jgi:TM2 domain-containing membrane protein YozV